LEALVRHVHSRRWEGKPWCFRGPPSPWKFRGPVVWSMLGYSSIIQVKCFLLVPSTSRKEVQDPVGILGLWRMHIPHWSRCSDPLPEGHGKLPALSGVHSRKFCPTGPGWGMDLADLTNFHSKWIRVVSGAAKV
jgi:hypothetical protein